jgi:hypothetical protein
MTELIRRFVWALSHDTSTVVQAISAAVTAVATLVLVAITRTYVKLTNELARMSTLQLSAIVQPKLLLSVGSEYPLAFGEIQALIRNQGDQPVKLKKVLISWPGTDDKPRYHPVNVMPNRVLLPEAQGGDRIDELVRLVGEEKESIRQNPGADEYGVWFDLIVDCTDMAEVTRHCFDLSQEFGLFHHRRFHDDDNDDHRSRILRWLPKGKKLRAAASAGATAIRRGTGGRTPKT